MDKIYSRRKWRFSAKKGNVKIKNGKISCLIVVLVIAFITTAKVIGAVTPIFNYLGTNKVKSIATIIMNDQVTDVIKIHTYDEMFTIEKDMNENVSMIKSNVMAINEITSNIAVKIQERLDELDREELEIPLGSFTAVTWLAGTGPNIYIEVRPEGVVETNIRSEFVSVGINQTIHRIYLDITCDIGIITPYSQNTEEIRNQVLLIENIIVGIVPSTNYDLDGLDKADAIEVME